MVRTGCFSKDSVIHIVVGSFSLSTLILFASFAFNFHSPQCDDTPFLSILYSTVFMFMLFGCEHISVIFGENIPIVKERERNRERV